MQGPTTWFSGGSSVQKIHRTTPSLRAVKGVSTCDRRSNLRSAVCSFRLGASQSSGLNPGGGPRAGPCSEMNMTNLNGVTRRGPSRTAALDVNRASLRS